MSVRVEHGDSREVLKTLPDASVDSVVTDTPYALVSIVKRFGKEGSAPCKVDRFSGHDGADKGASPYKRASSGFMGKKWDTGETAHDPAFWREVLRVLKPGGHLIAFGGTRTSHRMVSAIEDAGFEIRDEIANLIASDGPAQRFLASLNQAQVEAFFRCVEESEFGGRLEWVFGSGFPKSHNQKGDWEGWGTALKPAHEPICLARKPLDGTVAANVLQHGTGAINIDGCRIETGDDLNGGTYSGSRRARETYTSTDTAPGATPLNRLANGAGEFVPPPGRWPANVIHDGSDEVVAAFPEAPGQQRAVTGDEPSSPTKNVYGARGRRPSGFGNVGAGKGDPVPNGPMHNDSGSAARFFYSAKADAEDRLGSKHPTVKPIDLIAYLCRLVTPPGGTVLDPFAGSGTTGAACLREGFDCILIEREAEYIPDIMARIELASADGRHPAVIKHRNVDPDKAKGADLPMFAGLDGAA